MLPRGVRTKAQLLMLQEKHKWLSSWWWVPSLDFDAQQTLDGGSSVLGNERQMWPGGGSARNIEPDNETPEG